MYFCTEYLAADALGGRFQSGGESAGGGWGCEKNLLKEGGTLKNARARMKMLKVQPGLERRGETGEG